MLTILYGLSSALSWGTADFCGALASRKARSFQAVIYGEAFGLLFLLIASLFITEPGLTLSSWLLCSAAGASGVLGLLFFFYSFTRKQIAFVAPVSALVGTILPVIVGSIWEGFPSWWTFSGFCLALLAIWLVSQSGQESGKLRGRLQELAFPILAGVFFGLYFVLFHAGSRQGLLWPLVSARSAGVFIVLVFALLTRRSLLPSQGVWHFFILNGIFDAGGNAFYLLAGQAGRMDIAAVVASLYPAVTILLAWTILRERIGRTQLAGILTALAAIILLTI